MSETENLYALFAVVRQYVLAAGGDGDGWIVSVNYLKYANAFEAYEKLGDAWFTERHDRTGVLVSFTHEQEGVFFVNNRERLPEWAGDIVVEIY